MTREEQRVLRRRAADAVARGESIGDVARTLNLSRQTVINACDEFDVRRPSRKPARGRYHRPRTSHARAAQPAVV